MRPEIDGYLSRGTLMYRDQNYQGAIDQLTQLKRMSPDSHQAEEADFYIALSRLYRGELSEARQLLEAFIGDYPSSSHMLTALMSIADCDFYEGEYEQALARYNAIPESALDLAAAEDYRYRKAYSLMKLDEWDAAMNQFASLRSTKRYSNAARFYQGYIYYAQGDYSQSQGAPVERKHLNRARQPRRLLPHPDSLHRGATTTKPYRWHARR